MPNQVFSYHLPFLPPSYWDAYMINPHTKGMVLRPPARAFKESCVSKFKEQDRIASRYMTEGFSMLYYQLEILFLVNPTANLKRPDLTNLVKLLEDALMEHHQIDDDSVITTKMYRREAPDDLLIENFYTDKKGKPYKPRRCKGTTHLKFTTSDYSEDELETELIKTFKLKELI